MALQVDQTGGADIGRLHALHHRVTGKLSTDRLAYDRASAVAADQIAASHASCEAGIEIAQGDGGGGFLYRNILDRGAVEDADARLRGCVFEQDRLEEYLVDAMRRFRRGPIAVRPVLYREAVAAGGNFDPRQLLAGKGRAIADVVRISGRQASVADLLGKAEPTEDLHGARSDVIALRLRRLPGLTRFHYGDVNAAPGEIDRQRQSHWAGAHDQHIAIRHLQQGPDITGAILSSFRFGSRILHDHRPAVDLAADVGGKAVRSRWWQRLQRKRDEFFARRRIRHQLADLRGEFIDDGPGRAGRRHNALPGHELVALQSAFRDGRDIGRDRHPLRRRDAEHPDLALLDLLQRGLQVDHHEGDVPGDHVEHGRNAAAVRHVPDIDAGCRLQHLGAEMLRAAVAGRAIGEAR